MGNLAAALNAMQNRNNPQPQPAAYQPVFVNQPAQTQYTSRQATRQALCAAIKAERKAQGMTQRRLAAKSGMSQGSITRAEKHMWISLDALMRIAAGLGKQLTLT